jgi:hypothetical protein
MTASVNMSSVDDRSKLTCQYISYEYLSVHRGYKMNADKFPLLRFALCLVFLALSSEPTSANPVYVNLMIDANFPINSTPIETDSAFGLILNLTNILDDRGLNATIFVTPEMATDQSILVTTLGMRVSHELAAKVTDLSLGETPASEQDAYLKQVKAVIDSAHICEGPKANTVNLRGFMLPLSGQNEGIYKILDMVGAVYDAGFDQGIENQSVHDKDIWPYRIENHSLYAIPISSYLSNGKQVLLSDRIMKEEMRMIGPQWHDILVSRFDQSVRDGVPMVALFNSSISGSGDYLDAYKEFIGYAASKNASFVSTLELVNNTRARNPLDHVPSVMAKPDCPECDKMKSSS